MDDEDINYPSEKGEPSPDDLSEIEDDYLDHENYDEDLADDELDDDFEDDEESV